MKVTTQIPTSRSVQRSVELKGTTFQESGDFEFFNLLLICLQLLLFGLLLWKLPTIESLTVPLRNLFRIPFLALLAGILLVMVKASPIRALGIFVAVILFQPAIQSEQWTPNKFFLLFILAGSLVLFFKQRPLKSSAEVFLCGIVAVTYLFTAIAYPGSDSPIISWGVYILAGGFLCGFCRSLHPNRDQLKSLVRVSGTSIVLMALLSIASARYNNRLPLSYTELIISGFRLGQIDMESFNTFGFCCALGLLNWLAYVSLGGKVIAGVLGAVICAVCMIASKTLSVLAVLGVLAPIFVWHMSKDQLVFRFIGLSVWLLAIVGGIFIITSDLDLLSLGSRDKETGSGRLIIWDWAVSIIWSQPLGMGWEEYAARAPIVQKYVNLQGEEYLPILSPHNSILTSFIFGGLIGGLLFTILMTLWVIRSTKMLMSATTGSLLGCIGLLSVLTHLTMDFWYFNFFLGIIWIYLPYQASPAG